MSRTSRRRRGSDQEHRDAAHEHANGSARPLLVHQASAPQVLNFSRRRYLALVRTKGIRHSRVGRLVVCRVDDVLAALGLVHRAAVSSAPPERTRDAIVADIMRGASRKAGA